MKKIYIAGPYSSDNVIGVLNNIRRGIRISTEFLMDGYAVFCPWLDFQIALSLRDDERIPKLLYQMNSMAWLEVSDLVFVLKGSESSNGVTREIVRAKELKIPVIYEQDDPIACGRCGYKFKRRIDSEICPGCIDLNQSKSIIHKP